MKAGAERAGNGAADGGPLPSLVIGWRNAAATIGDTFAGVPAQRGPGAGYVVVDGGWNDGTVELIGPARPGPSAPGCPPRSRHLD